VTPTQALTLVPVLLSFALVFYWLARKFGFPVLAGTLLALLIHEWLIRWLTYLVKAPPVIVTAASLWKDGALIGLGVVWLQRSLAQLRPKGAPPLRKRVGLLHGLMAALVALGVVSALLSPNRLAGIVAFRDYYEPMLLFIVVGAFYPTKRQLGRFVSGWLAILGLMAVLGIIQTTLWSPADYERWWFGPAGGQSGIPDVGLRGEVRFRAPSTVTGPNELGMHMVLGLLTVSQLMLTADRRYHRPYLALGLLFGIALVLTFSRSDLIAYAVGLAVIYSLHRRDRGAILGRWSLQNGAILGVMFAVALQTGLLGHVALTATAPQDQYHSQDITAALGYLVKDPSGVGMGLVGPRDGAFFPVQPAYHVEGSIFQIAFEMGVWGAALWIAFAAAVVIAALRGWKRAEEPLDRAMVGTALGGGLGLSLVLLFLPLMQSMPLMSWIWFLLGFAVHLGRSRADSHGNHPV
jgi:O-antigen ligase